jgi:hypothetical protein
VSTESLARGLGHRGREVDDLGDAVLEEEARDQELIAGVADDEQQLARLLPHMQASADIAPRRHPFRGMMDKTRIEPRAATAGVRLFEASRVIRPSQDLCPLNRLP